MDSSEHAIINEVSSEQETKVDVEMINRDDIQEINLELDESQQEEDDNSSKKKRLTMNGSRRTRKKRTKNMMMMT
jgi:glycerol-3-phosphate cytidylyltransferase-like family protein